MRKNNLILAITIALLLNFGSQALAVDKLFLNYGPYTLISESPDRGTYIPWQQVYDQIHFLAPHVQWVKTFTSTHGLENVGPIARPLGIRVAAGCWLSSDKVQNEIELAALIAVCLRGDADVAVIGSETLYRGDLTSAELIAYINRFRQAVPGFMVVTADTAGALLNNPAVANASDAVVANVYPYWEGVSIINAPAFLRDRYYALKNQFPDKRIVIGETGWPTTGNHVFGNDIPEEAFYFCAIMSWARTEGVIIFNFEAFDEPWKKGPKDPRGDQWGIWDQDYALKPYMNYTLDGLVLAPYYWSHVPGITFMHVPLYGSSDNLQGMVFNTSSANYAVAVYIKVGGGWWIKPTFANPLTWINADGTFICDITTGGSDTKATEIAAFIVPRGYLPPAIGGSGILPAVLYQNSIANIQITR